MTWNELSASTRRRTAMGGGIVVFILLCWIIAEGLQSETGKSVRSEINEAILTDVDTRQTSIDSLSTQVESARSANETLSERLAQLEEEQERIPEAVAKALQRDQDQAAGQRERALEKRLKELEGQLQTLDQQLVTAKEEAEADRDPPEKETDEPVKALLPEDEPGGSTEDPGASDQSVVKAAAPAIVFPENESPTPSNPTSIFQTPAVAPPPPSSSNQPAAATGGEAEAAASNALAIRFVSKKDAAADPATAGNKALPEEGENLFRLPATSILTGTLITGLDAPTGAQAQGEPLPVLLRLKKEAILPNRFKADVRECFALLGAYGDLSSERAHMRGETMSCVLNDGTILEQPLKAFAVGEDGKEGPRGRLVRREGTFLARALLVGFLEAGANAFDNNQVAVVGGGASYDLEGAQAAATSLGGSAAGNALGRIADWYIDQAFQLFPVIEIDAGRQIDVVLTSTLEMNLPTEDG